MRSWFGLVNQVAYVFAAKDVMAPFRDLLKKGSWFTWMIELQTAFKVSKSVIVNKV